MKEKPRALAASSGSFCSLRASKRVGRSLRTPSCKKVPTLAPPRRQRWEEEFAARVFFFSSSASTPRPGRVLGLLSFLFLLNLNRFQKKNPQNSRPRRRHGAAPPQSGREGVCSPFFGPFDGGSRRGQLSAVVRDDARRRRRRRRRRFVVVVKRRQRRRRRCPRCSLERERGTRGQRRGGILPPPPPPAAAALWREQRAQRQPQRQRRLDLGSPPPPPLRPPPRRRRLRRRRPSSAARPRALPPREGRRSRQGRAAQEELCAEGARGGGGGAEDGEFEVFFSSVFPPFFLRIPTLSLPHRPLSLDPLFLVLKQKRSTSATSTAPSPRPSSPRSLRTPGRSSTAGSVATPTRRCGSRSSSSGRSGRSGTRSR